jgi:hypothetical protein
VQDVRGIKFGRPRASIRPGILGATDGGGSSAVLAERLGRSEGRINNMATGFQGPRSESGLAGIHSPAFTAYFVI